MIWRLPPDSLLTLPKGLSNVLQEYWMSKRPLYEALGMLGFWGTIINVAFLFILGIVATIHQTTATNYTQAVLGILISFVYAGSLGPISYTIIAETSSVRLRALSTGVGRAAYYIAEIPMIYLASRLLNPTGWNLGGKCGYVWGGTAVICFVSAYFFLPELKDRSYRETDILFKRKVPARKFGDHVFTEEGVGAKGEEV